MMMNAKQQEAYDHVTQGHNVFITGPAGTGKSFLIKYIQKWAMDNGRKMATTATTGAAAYLIGGRTIHSKLGLGLGKDDPVQIATYIKNRRKDILKEIKLLNIIILDEVSMLSADLFEKISEVLQILRGNSDAFGGIQMVFSGDFFQLPPVDGEMCFKSPLWGTAIYKTIILEELMRQMDDVDFQDILTEVRFGKLSKKSVAALKARVGVQSNTTLTGIEPTVLFSHRKNVDVINKTEYQKVKTAVATAIEREYPTKYITPKGKLTVEHTKAWADKCNIPTSVHLMHGTQVILTYNISQEEGLINGTRGVVEDVTDDGPVIRTKNGKRHLIPLQTVTNDTQELSVSYLPVAYAWALTIHKSQGMTIDAVQLDLGDSIFAFGQAYTALSRVKNLESLYLTSFKESVCKTHPEVFKAFTVTQENDVIPKMAGLVV
jgi:ATP-dependent DNA helicase PIF1